MPANRQTDILITILRTHAGLDDIISVNRLRWYGHVLRKEDSDWVKKCMEYEVEGARPLTGTMPWTPLGNFRPL